MHETSEAAGILNAVSGNRAPRDADFVRVFTTAQLLARGFTDRRIRTLVGSGRLIRVGQGCYVTAKATRSALDHPEGRHLLAAGAALARSGPGLIASHTTAARIHGLDLLGRPGDEVTLTRVPGTGSRRPRSGVRQMSAHVPPGQAAKRHGLRVTSVARTVVDVARTSSFRAGVVTADSALRMKLTTKDELRAVLATCRQWPGSVRAAAVVEFADKLSESALESICRVAFRDLGLPPPRLQVRVGNELDEIARVDFLWREFNTIAEADGALKYADPDKARQQLWRDARLHEAGFQVVHITWNEITRYQDNVAGALRAAFQRGLALRDAEAS
jgi:very-short-patch-repair endonuclease